MKRVIGYVVVPVLAFFIARLTVTTPAAIEPAREVAVHERTTQVITRGGNNEDLRAIIREELAATAADKAVPAAVPEAHEPEKTVEPSSRLVRALAIVDTAKISGRWGDEEREQFRGELHQLSGDEAFQAARALAAAINQQRVIPDGPVL